MAILLFKLNNVPDDEAREVRELLDEGGFDIYETSAGRWRIGVAAIWLANPQQLQQARAALDSYQNARARRMREHYDQLKLSGQMPGLSQKLAANPAQFVGYLFAIGIILALMVLPFIGFLGD